MSDETVMRFKLATLVTIAMGILSMAVTGIGIWVGGLNSTVAGHDRDIATLQECTRNQTATLTRIETMLESIRSDQLRRERKEQGR